MKKTAYLFLVIALALSHTMCAVVAFNYSSMLCGIEHSGFSAPASTALLFAIPFLVLIVACLVLAWVLYKKSKK